MTEREYTLRDLASITRLDPRTIRFYIAQKLLKGPDEKGRHAKYSEYHLKRLQVIKKLSRKYKMPLKEIRSHLMRAKDDEDIELAEVVLEERPFLREERHLYSPSPGMSSSRQRSRMARERAMDTRHADMEHRAAREHRSMEPYAKQSAYPEDATPLDKLVGSLEKAVPAKRPSSSSKVESWHVIEITPEVKLQVSGDFSISELVRFEEVADYIREILLGGDKT